VLVLRVLKDTTLLVVTLDRAELLPLERLAELLT